MHASYSSDEQVVYFPTYVSAANRVETSTHSLLILQIHANLLPKKGPKTSKKKKAADDGQDSS